MVCGVGWGEVGGWAINSIFTKLDLPKADADHRRVLAVLRFLGADVIELDDELCPAPGAPRPEGLGTAAAAASPPSSPSPTARPAGRTCARFRSR